MGSLACSKADSNFPFMVMLKKVEIKRKNNVPYNYVHARTFIVAAIQSLRPSCFVSYHNMCNTDTGQTLIFLFEPREIHTEQCLRFRTYQ